MTITVKDLLRNKGGGVAVVAPTDWVVDAARVMRERRVGCLVVVDRGRVCGILTERDLLTRVVAERRDAADTAVGEVMSSEVYVCRPDTTIEACKQLVSSRRVRHLPVVDPGGRLVGVITSGDILAYELAGNCETLETLREHVVAAMASPRDTKTN